MNQSRSSKLLVIENNAESGDEIRQYFQDKGWQVKIAVDIKQVQALLLDDEFNPHVILANLSTQHSDNLLDQFQTLDESFEHAEWIFVLPDTTQTKAQDKERNQIDQARIDELAHDVLPAAALLDFQRLDHAIHSAQRAARTARRLKQYAKADLKRYHFEAYIGKSQAVVDLRSLLKQLSEVPISTLIITGETGTGKGLVARIIHHSGLRKDGPLVELNCAALPKELLESQLFGHEAGAFTGAKGRYKGLLEQADGGTLFLDEIGDMDIELQAKLLKAIEDKRIRRLGSERETEVDAQIIAATGVDLEKAAREGEFRDDLYHRLSVFCVNLPPLRERKDDLIELVPRIIAEYNAKANKHIEVISDPVWEQLLSHDWPGNVRELRNVIERCVLLSSDNTLPAKWLQLSDTSSVESNTAISDNAIMIPLDGSMALDEMDSHIIQTALQLNDYNITETARVLKTTRETLRYRIQKYKLQTSK